MNIKYSKIITAADCLVTTSHSLPKMSAVMQMFRMSVVTNLRAENHYYESTSLVLILSKFNLFHVSLPHYMLHSHFSLLQEKEGKRERVRVCLLKSRVTWIFYNARGEIGAYFFKVKFIRTTDCYSFWLVKNKTNSQDLWLDSTM